MGRRRTRGRYACAIRRQSAAHEGPLYGVGGRTDTDVDPMAPIRHRAGRDRGPYLASPSTDRLGAGGDAQAGGRGIQEYTDHERSTRAAAANGDGQPDALAGGRLRTLSRAGAVRE